MAGTWSLPTPPKDAPEKLIPYPQKVEWGKRRLSFDNCRVKIIGFDSKDQSGFRKELYSVLAEKRINANASSSMALIIRRQPVPEAHIPEEAYQLSVSSKGVVISADTAQGIFNGLQTLRQLIPTGSRKIPTCRISDWPAFKVRGFMHDLGRFYQSPDFLKKQLRKLSKYKINTFHMHLTDDPAWRVEVKAHPELTAAENHWPSRLPGKFYTQDEIRDLVKFCRKLHIEVIPEIDMPGHSKSFTKATGYNMQTPEGMKILQECLKEILPLFPSRKFHIGSDEVRVTMKEFIPEMTRFIRSQGKELVVWNPGHLPDNQVISMNWGDNVGHHASSYQRFIDTNGFYMDWIDSQSGVYQYFFQQPCSTPNGSDKALGAIAPVWCDGALSDQDRVLKQYPFYPCMLTFAERIWRGANEKRVDLMAKLPAPGSDAFAAFAEFEERLIYHRDRNFKTEPFAYVKQSQISWKVIGPFNHNGVNNKSFEPEQKIKPVYLDGEKQLKWRTAFGGAIHLRHFYDVFNSHRNHYRINHWPAVMTDLVGKENGTCYALTYIYSPKPQDLHLMFGIGGMWGHSGGYRSAQPPKQGEWDFSGGDIWLNNKRLQPPKWPFESLPWTGWGRGRIENAPLTAEGYFFRPPVKIHFKKGWNKVLIRIPFGWWRGDKGQRKWFFNCIPVSWDGKHYREVQGLKYDCSLR